MRYKIGVKLPKVLDARMFIALEAIEWAWINATQGLEDVPMEPTITSWADGAHMPGSYHKQNGRAVDVRTKDLPRDLVKPFVDDIKKRIGALGFDVILEERNRDNEHAHIEADARMDV